VRIGEEFNPWRRFEFAPLPAAVMRSRALSGNAKVLLGALLKRAGKDGRCWPSQATLAADCGMTRNQVRYALAHLIAHDLIGVRRTQQGGSNHYEFNEATICGVGESFNQGGVNSPGLVNGSPRKESIKEGPIGPRLVVDTKPGPPSPPLKECARCDGTGWESVKVRGIDAVKRCGCHG